MATIVSDTTVTDPDGTTQQTVIYSDGSRSITTTPGPNTPAANQATIVQRAQAALAANATYLALASPNTAQNTAQVQRLTRQCNAIIRLLLNQLDDTTGT